ncbi:MAG: serine/threonine protein phosphatase [Ruminiclostridium sp.]|nr:serine/threonine protein phosphatase [Ruminiclostridium sp.]
MALYAISDLHLALSTDKPMDIFGTGWLNYMERINRHWQAIVSEGDTVIIPGDISWATYLENSVEDFKFIDSLPGRKIISKGNHDYWWTTVSKLERFLSDNGFSTISFMHNNSFRVENSVICGTRGWKIPGDDGFNAEDRKIYQRELQRLELSLKSAEVLPGDRLIAAIHFPVLNSKGVFSEFLEIMQRYGVNLCIYGHLHGDAFKNAVEGMQGGVEFRLVSADYLEFKPLML